MAVHLSGHSWSVPWIGFTEIRNVRVAFVLLELIFILHIFFWGKEASCLEMYAFHVDEYLWLEFLGWIVIHFADMLTGSFSWFVVGCSGLVWG